MKTITNILIAVLICSMFLTYLPMQAQSPSTITIEASQKGVSENTLKSAAAIISARLEEFTGKKVNCEIRTSQNRISLTFKGDPKDELLRFLITEKGEVNFSEVFRLDELKRVNGTMDTLKSLSEEGRANDWSFCFSKDQQKNLMMLIRNTVWPDSVRPAWSYPDFQCCYFLKVKKEVSSGLSSNAIEKSSWKTSRNQHAEINIRFKPGQVKAWSDLTRSNINRVLAISLDGKILSAPKVMSAIDGGNCIITGSFDNREAACISSVLGHGPLPVNFSIVE